MAETKVGQSVSVDMSGYQATGVVVSEGTHLSGKVVSIDDSSKEITVKLIEPFMGRKKITVNPERVTEK